MTSLEEFVANPSQHLISLHLPHEDKREVKSIANDIRQRLEKELKSIPITFIIGGSYGKGTYVKGRREIDLVVTCYDPDLPLEDFRKTLFEAADSIADRITKEYSSIRLPKRYRRYSRLLEYQGVKFDILAAIPIDSPKEFLEYPEEKTAEMSASASKFQIEFVKQQPSACKDFIRYCKYWRTFFRWSGKGPASYLIEVLCINVYQNETAEDTPFNWRNAFKSFLEMVIDPEINLYTPHSKKVARRAIRERFPGEPRVILDPGNPANNLATSAIGDWQQFEGAAYQTLEIMNEQDESDN